MTVKLNELSASRIVDLLSAKGYQCDVWGQPERVVSRALPVSHSTESSLCFIRDGRNFISEQLHQIQGVVIAPKEMRQLVDRAIKSATWILVDSPDAAFYETLRLMFVNDEGVETHESAIVLSGASLGRDVSIGPFSRIGSGVTIGSGVIVGSGCSIQNCVIGDSVQIQDGVMIGSEALGAVKRPNGTWVDRVSIGIVHIGSRSRIENNSVVQRGFLSDTRIGEDVRIGPNCSIGNGVTVGRGSLIAQGVVVAGSVQIGEDCAVWGNASIREGIHLGVGCTVGMGAVVLNNLDRNSTYVGVPARKLR